MKGYKKIKKEVDKVFKDFLTINPKHRANLTLIRMLFDVLFYLAGKEVKK
jgi:hypothetical protein